MSETKYTRAELLEILRAYKRQIERSGKEFPAVVLSDIEKSIEYVLKEAQL
jgi:hypothetical protein